MSCRAHGIFQLDTAGHFRILAHEDTIRTILEATAEEPAGAPAPPPESSA